MQERPESSCVSMKSNQSIEQPVNLKDKDTCEHRGTQQERPEPSCVSMRSNQSIEQPVNLKDKNTREHSEIQQERSNSSDPSCVSMRSNQSIEQPVNLRDRHTSEHRIQQRRSDLPEPNNVSMRTDDQKIEQPVIIFKNSNGSQLVLDTFKTNLIKKFQCLFEGIAKQGNPTLLKEIYTELYITESERGEISNEHEVRQIETHPRRTTTEETPIKCNDIFKPLPEQHKHIRSVLTKGVAGIGKTVSVQKFILDWAEEKENQDIHLIFPLPFREINLMKDKTLSLLDLLYLFFPETKEMEIFSDKYKVLFIFDGLDECRMSLDFHSRVKLCDVSESTSEDMMLTKLIKGNLFPSALIWITSRPAAADLIPSECVDRVTEVRGFSDPQKEEYFRKRISDESLSDQIISHLKSSRSLYIMCHIPVFCWISVTVLERILREAENQEIPKTLTQMYTHFLIIQTNIKHQKHYEKNVKNEEMIFKLGKLAFEQLVKGNLIFYDEDLRECDIDIADASVYSGLCTQIFREEFGLYHGKVYCFVHLSIQEHLAAIYVHISLVYKNVNVLTQMTTPRILSAFSNVMKFVSSKQVSITELHKKAVHMALKSKNGHLDLFLRFLLGLSVESNQFLLKGLMAQTGNFCQSKEETIEYIKQKIRHNPSPEKTLNLFHCLNELDDQSIWKEIQKFLQSGEIRKMKLSSSQWAALIFVLLTSKQEMDEFVLNKFVGKQHTSNEVILKLLPVIKMSRSVHLNDLYNAAEGVTALASALGSSPSHIRELTLSRNNWNSDMSLLFPSLGDAHCKLEKLTISQCYITYEGCADLASALKLNPSHLKELNLYDIEIQNSGVNLLSAVLENPYCNLETLGLRKCGITDRGCAALASVLRSNPSHLRELELSWNKVGDSGMELLSAELASPHCKLEVLKLQGCGVKKQGCATLVSALRSNPSHLTQLNLNGNELGDTGMKLLAAVLENPHCKLQILSLYGCGVKNEGAVALDSFLRSNTSQLRYLNLSRNDIGDAGVKLLSPILENSDCKLQILRMSDFIDTEEAGSALASALRSNPSYLRELDVSGKKSGNLGMMLSNVLEKPYCKLQKLRLEECNITEEDCDALFSALRSNPSHLIDLNLNSNKLEDSGVKLLCAALENPQCKLQRLGLWGCNITEKGCAALSSALRLNPSHLIDLNLNSNKLEDSGVKLLCDALKNPQCKIQRLGLCSCDITADCCAALASALRSNQHLRDLQLSHNQLGDSGMLLLSTELSTPSCKLERLELCDCNITDEGCGFLATALKSNPSHLRALNLTRNKIGNSGDALLKALKNNPSYKLENV
ncbi:NACHT, LRR and PYD domains-containing protein 3-like isoform X2 [Misgurnus anguillicaudatus]